MGLSILHSRIGFIHLVIESNGQPRATRGGKRPRNCPLQRQEGMRYIVQLLPHSGPGWLTLPVLGTNGEIGGVKKADVHPHGNVGISKCNHLMSFLALKLYSIMVLLVTTRSHRRANVGYGVQFLWICLYYYCQLNSSESPSVFNRLSTLVAGGASKVELQLFAVFFLSF